MSAGKDSLEQSDLRRCVDRNASGWLAEPQPPAHCFRDFLVLVALIPVSNLVPTSTKMADRYLFVPTVGAVSGYTRAGHMAVIPTIAVS